MNKFGRRGIWIISKFPCGEEATASSISASVAGDAHSGLFIWLRVVGDAVLSLFLALPFHSSCGFYLREC